MNLDKLRDLLRQVEYATARLRDARQALSDNERLLAHFETDDRCVQAAEAWRGFVIERRAEVDKAERECNRLFSLYDLVEKEQGDA